MKSRLAWWLIALSIVCAAAVLAQVTASITGTVTDPSGAAVRNAQEAAIGTRVTVKAGKLVQISEVRAGGSYLSQNLRACTSD